MTDQKLVERILLEIIQHIDELENAADITWEIYQTDKRARRYVERTLQIMIEACLDASHHIISEKKYREPESYRDAFTVLAENGILHQSDLSKFHKIASFRKLIVYYYDRIDDAVVYGIFKRNLTDFRLFADRIRQFLKAEETIAKFEIVG